MARALQQVGRCGAAAAAKYLQSRHLRRGLCYIAAL